MMDGEAMIENLRDVLPMGRDDAKALLERHDWDLQAAVNAEFERTATTEPTLTTPLLPANPPEALRSKDEVGGVQRVMELVSRALLSAYSFARSVLNLILDLVARSWFFKVTKPFPAHYREQFGAQPQFINGTFTRAIREARQQGRLLFVYLHRGYHAPSNVFVESVLKYGPVAANLRESHVVWGCLWNSPAADEVRDLFRMVGAPGAAIFVPKDESSVTMVAKIGVADGAENVLSMLQLCERQWKAGLQREVSDKHRKLAEDRELRRQQEEDYAATVDADRAKWEEADQRAQEEQLRTEMSAAAKHRETRRKSLTVEFAKPQPDATGPAARIRLSLPSGQKFERRFAPDDPVQLLYDWAESLEFPLPHDEDQKTVPIPPNFLLVLPMPPTELVELEASLDEAGLTPNASILLKEIFDD